MYVGIENLKDITSYLIPLDKTAIIHLGIVLGLNYYRLKTMMDTPTFLSEMLSGWRGWTKCYRQEFLHGSGW